MLVNCLLKMPEIKNVMKWNVSNTMTVIQMTQKFVMNRSTTSPTANVSMLGTQVLGSWRSDIYLLKISNIKEMTPNMIPHKLL